MMVLDVFNFITLNKERMNIYSYLKEKIIESGIKAVYEELVEIYAARDNNKKTRLKKWTDETRIIFRDIE